MPTSLLTYKIQAVNTGTRQRSPDEWVDYRVNDSIKEKFDAIKLVLADCDRLYYIGALDDGMFPYTMFSFHVKNVGAFTVMPYDPIEDVTIPDLDKFIIEYENSRDKDEWKEWYRKFHTQMALRSQRAITAYHRELKK